MILLFLTAITTDLAQRPVPENDPADWVTGKDGKGQIGITEFRLLIDEKGKAYRCDVTATSGTANLDRLTCRLALKRARFKPAIGSDGMQISSTYSQTVRWGWVKPSDWDRRGANIILHVSPLPPSYGGNFLWFLQTVGADGRDLQCRTTDATVSQPLEDKVCKALSEHATPLTDAKGNQTKFLISWKVGLTTGSVPTRPPRGATYALED